MADEIEINLTEALDAACRAFAKHAGFDWDTADPGQVKFNVREMLAIPLEAALPFIVVQIMAAISVDDAVINPEKASAQEWFDSIPIHVENNGNLNPDCKGGKHQACSGTAWDVVINELVLCDCVCHAPKEEPCHCGKPIYTELDGFTRGLCALCSQERCDAPTEDGVYSCSAFSKKEN